MLQGIPRFLLRLKTGIYGDNVECSKVLFNRRYTFFTCFLVKTYSYILNKICFIPYFFLSIYAVAVPVGMNTQCLSG